MFDAGDPVDERTGLQRNVVRGISIAAFTFNDPHHVIGVVFIKAGAMGLVGVAADDTPAEHGALFEHSAHMLSASLHDKNVNSRS